MNYRHAFHAGNRADVLKHAVLAFILDYLCAKETPWRFIDTHAGIGLYDLTSDEALRTGEWVEGIGRLWGKALPEPLELLLSPYLTHIARLNPVGRLLTYPGSPDLAVSTARATDGVTLCELHPDDAEILAALYRRDGRVKVINLDGWLAPKAFVPPKESRGVLLVDPPFESRDDYGRLFDALVEAQRRWAPGIKILWYPVKDRRIANDFLRAVGGLGMPKTLMVEMAWREADGERLSGAGLVIVNPPYTLAPALRAAGSQLMDALGAPDGRLQVTGGSE